MGRETVSWREVSGEQGWFCQWMARSGARGISWGSVTQPMELQIWTKTETEKFVNDPQVCC